VQALDGLDLLPAAVTSSAPWPRFARMPALQVAREGQHSAADAFDAVLVDMAKRPVLVAQRLQLGRGAGA
jgi:hypothetical protein